MSFNVNCSDNIYNAWGAGQAQGFVTDSGQDSYTQFCPQRFSVSQYLRPFSHAFPNIAADMSQLLISGKIKEEEKQSLNDDVSLIENQDIFPIENRQIQSSTLGIDTAGASWQPISEEDSLDLAKRVQKTSSLNRDRRLQNSARRLYFDNHMLRNRNKSPVNRLVGRCFNCKEPKTENQLYVDQKIGLFGLCFPCYIKLRPNKKL
jgi:hypothetical protein